MALNTQKTTDTGMGMNTAKYYDKTLMENARPQLVHYQLGVKALLPKNSGKTFQFRRWEVLEPNTAPLSEGVVPDGQNISVSTVDALVQGYGQYVACTDLLELTSLDKFIQGAAQELGAQGGSTIDAVVRDVITAGTGVTYAGSATSRATVSATMKLTVEDIRKAVKQLKKKNAPKFKRGVNEYYVAIVAPETAYDLQSDPLWIDASKYAATEQLLSGELGRIFGCLLVESSNAKKFVGAGAASADVYATVFLGEKAFGVIDIMKDSNPAQIKTIVKNRGSAGSSDPLNQITTVGWKVDAFAAAILNQDWIVRVEHGATK